MKRASRRPGFALLLVLLVLALGAATLGLRVLRVRAAAEATSTRTAALQRDWAARSAVDALAPVAGVALDRGGDHADTRRRPLPVERRFRLRLGPTDVLLVATDEQAKLDVNLLGPEPAAVAAAVAALTPPAPGAQPQPQPQPPLPLPRPLRVAVDPDADAPPPPAYLTLGQVFATSDAADLLGDRPGAGWAARLTCWGDRRLNWWTADPAALRTLLSSRLDPAATRRALAGRARGLPPGEALPREADAGAPAEERNERGGDGYPEEEEALDRYASDGEDGEDGFEPDAEDEPPREAPAAGNAAGLAALFVEETDRFGLWAVAASGRAAGAPRAGGCLLRVVDARGATRAEVRW